MGERIRSNGKFGGAGNKAPPVEKLHGFVFPAPISKKVDELAKTIELLRQLEEVMGNNSRAKDELKLQMAEGRSAEMRRKYKECVDAEKELAEIEEELGMTPSQYETPDPSLNILNSLSVEGSEERHEVPSEHLLKTIHQEVGNSIRMHNLMKRKGTPDSRNNLAGDENAGKSPKRGRGSVAEKRKNTTKDGEGSIPRKMSGKDDTNTRTRRARKLKVWS